MVITGINSYSPRGIEPVVVKALLAGIPLELHHIVPVAPMEPADSTQVVLEYLFT